MNRRVQRLNDEIYPDFFELHSEQHGGGWCYCVAWWLPTWAGWSKRTAEQNRTLREKICDMGIYDGYLLYVDDKPVGWCQTAMRDLFIKLVMQYKLEPDIDTWAITCFFIAKEYRRQGLASFMLGEVLRDLKKQKVKRVEAFPRREDKPTESDLWTGPESIYIKAGFHVVNDDPSRPVLAIRL
jgi:GNAT superfamily N-acetyltransferase